MNIKISVDHYSFIATMLVEQAPKTCEWFLEQLPFKSVFVQGAWSGEIFFAPLEYKAKHVPFEHPTSYPAPGEIILYPGNDLENGGELYIPYSGNRFACPTGQLAGSPFLKITEGLDQLRELGRAIRWEGAREITFEKI